MHVHLYVGVKNQNNINVQSLLNPLFSIVRMQVNSCFTVFQCFCSCYQRKTRSISIHFTSIICFESNYWFSLLIFHVFSSSISRTRHSWERMKVLWFLYSKWIYTFPNNNVTGVHDTVVLLLCEEPVIKSKGVKSTNIFICCVNRIFIKFVWNMFNGMNFEPVARIFKISQNIQSDSFHSLHCIRLM